LHNNSCTSNSAAFVKSKVRQTQYVGFPLKTVHLHLQAIQEATHPRTHKEANAAFCLCTLQTHVIVELLLRCLDSPEHLPVLVVAETHTAVDNVLRKLKHRVTAKPGHAEAGLLRLGDTSSVAKDLRT